MEQYSIGGLPVLSYGKLVGIITKRDIRFESDLETLVKDRMTSENLITVNSDTSYTYSYYIYEYTPFELITIHPWNRFVFHG